MYSTDSKTLVVGAFFCSCQCMWEGVHRDQEMGLVFGVFVNPVDSRRHRLCHWSVGGGAVMEKLN